ncbi:MAG: nickel/cobalt transporter [Pseudorhodoplanes sp.]|nr:nickel/cobalt transporter [Pseudorhodoplanes sp.]MCL4710487.1 nickel/cobalt transporter [Pseudorhodoplanes sp.]
MPMSAWPPARLRAAALTGLAVVAALAVCAELHSALAQVAPFGAPRPSAAPPPADGIVGWILAKQAEFYRAMARTIRTAKSDGTALYALFGISFLYGVFHAAGPGHGKAVISSYLVANEETWRRGVVLSFASAFLQALVAVLIVGIAAALLGATAKVMDDAVRYIEIISYALIAAIGARLLWVKGRAFLSVWCAPADGHHDHHHGHHHDHAHGAHAHRNDHAHHHDHDDHAGHAHGPEPAELAGPGGWQRGLSAIVAVGLRPCSGAILVLVFALAQGLFWAGVAATFLMGLGTAITVAAIATLAVGAKALARRLASSHAGRGMLVVRGIEVLAAALVLVFGLALLAGYMASERMFV